ncbi:MAG: nucleoside deaminase [Cyanobacteria bacterium SZAS LIN-2]|nr:nucleoside deaminase [Cyanobacteria bacterium SZAS LIN-2]MBS2008103.1 nucleoside deaminase [Cyanobacteria bacterium SZAS TMP-1]
MIGKIARRSFLCGTAGIVAGATALRADAHTPVALPQAFKDLDHERFMRLAIEQAKKVPAYPFGSVVVNAKSGKVVAEGWVKADKNPIWHGEMTAIYNCPEESDEFKWQDACLYTTGESCPMCQSAIVWSKMPLVVYGSSIPFLQKCGFGQINIRAQKIVDAALFDYGNCTILGGVLEKDCNILFEKAKSMSSRSPNPADGKN